MAKNLPTPDLEHLTKENLHDLADKLLAPDRLAIETCVEFLLADTKGNWHGRARAMLSRRLKHCDVPPDLSQQLVARIMGRLASGDFSEQFRDQIRLAIHLNPDRTFQLARESLTSSPKKHIRKLAQWVLDHEKRAEVPPDNSGP